MYRKLLLCVLTAENVRNSFEELPVQMNFWHSLLLFKNIQAVNEEHTCEVVNYTSDLSCPLRPQQDRIIWSFLISN